MSRGKIKTYKRKRGKYANRLRKHYVLPGEINMYGQQLDSMQESHTENNVQKVETQQEIMPTFPHSDMAHVYYSSLDYDKFSLIAINRSVDDRRIAKLVDAIEKEFNYLALFPAIVTPTFEITDGQHRFIAARLTRQRFYYIISSEFEMADAARAVSLTKGWTIKNYMESYAERKLPDYMLLQDFQEKHAWLPISFTVNLCSSQTYRNAIFNHGHYKADRMKFANRFVEMAEDYGERYDFYKTIVFLSTLTNLAGNPDYDHQKMIKKLDLVPTRFKRCATVESYLQLLTDIYNTSRHGSNRVYFIDRYRHEGKHVE